MPPVGEEFPLPGPPPGAQMDLVDVQRPVVDGVFLPVVQPGLVVPLVVPQLVELGGGAGPGLGVEGVGVGLHQQPAVRRLDRIFIGIIPGKSGDKALPQAAPQGGHGGLAVRPAVEIPHHRDLQGVGGPDSEDIALDPLPLLGVGAHIRPGPKGRAGGIRLNHPLLPGGGRSFAIHLQSPLFLGNIIQIMASPRLDDCQSN